MSEPKFDLTGDESEHDVGRHLPPSMAPEDHLQTTRLPAISPPPVGLFSSAPPSAVVAVAPRLPSFDPSPDDSVAPPSSTTDAPAGRPSWWRGLLTATFAPPGAGAIPARERVLRRRTAAVVALLGGMLVITSLVAGLRGPPAVDAAVAATAVASRTVMALGILAFAHALLRAAERLFFGAPPLDSPEAPRGPDADPPATH
jgi:hypothetical protein